MARPPRKAPPPRVVACLEVHEVIALKTCMESHERPLTLEERAALDKMEAAWARLQRRQQGDSP